nr:hypothetical protein CFP56_69563 [Quercus suber]
MPNGSSTPLGRQLRSVLADISRLPTVHPDYPSLGTRLYHATAQVDLTEDRDIRSVAQGASDGVPVSTSTVSWRSSSGRKKTPYKRPDYIGEALRTSGARFSVPCPPPKKLDFSFANPRRQVWRKAVRKHDDREEISGRVSSIQSILSHCIAHAGAKTTPVSLPSGDIAFLLKKGYKLSDVQAWASALLAPDSLDAAMILDNYAREKGWQAIPFIVHQYLLRRPYIKSAALKLIVRQTQVYLDARYQNRQPPAAGAQMLFVAFIRLVRHAREVWPQVMPSLAEMFFHYISVMDSTHAAATLAQKTSMLNKAMDLMSRSCAVQPLKDAMHSEAAVFHVLRCMAEHDPPIVLTRSGYRAVVRVQLSEKKNSMERQWAQLKALSWPPWKVDRTSKDSAITPEYGISRAGHTLARMREAGYAPQTWEKAAMIYAGWDLDGTPSIQTRISAELDSSGASNELIWAARIRSTRTAQEAWAAYLAFEDAGQPPSSVVYLAIFERLFAEEKRQREHHYPSKFPDAIKVPDREQILPGDSKEIAPLPPSSHLHTYTRSVPPTVLDFFESLEAREVMLDCTCLAFIVRNAASLQLGFRYLQYGQRAHPGIKNLLPVSDHESGTAFPDVVLTAVVELLCRYPGVTLKKDITDTSILRLDASDKSTLDNKTLNPYHPIVCAMKILKLQAPRFRPAYNAVLRALCRDKMHGSMPRLVIAGKGEATLDLDEQELEKNRDLLVIYRLVGQTLSLMDAASVELDASGVFYLCCAVENVAIASWKVLKNTHEQDQKLDVTSMGHTRKKETIVKEVQAWLRRGTPLERLKHEFAALVGCKIEANKEPVSLASSIRSLPRLLTVPHPWLLHAYIRAIGWMGDHKALVLTMQWMVEHHAELTLQMARDRNRESMMKKVFVAFKVFLERSWLTEVPKRERTSEFERQHASNRTHAYLQQFECPASSSTVEEMRELVASVKDWPDWPTDDEVEWYCQNERFMGVRKIYEQTANAHRTTNRTG